MKTYAVAIPVTVPGRVARQFIESTTQNWLSKLCNGYPMTSVELVQDTTSGFASDYDVKFNITLPDDADERALVELIDYRSRGAMSEIVVVGQAKIKPAPIGTRPFKSRRTTVRMSTPHGQCSDERGCVEPVSREEKCR